MGRWVHFKSATLFKLIFIHKHWIMQSLTYSYDVLSNSQNHTSLAWSVDVTGAYLIIVKPTSTQPVSYCSNLMNAVHINMELPYRRKFCRLKVTKYVKSWSFNNTPGMKRFQIVQFNGAIPFDSCLLTLSAYHMLNYLKSISCCLIYAYIHELKLNGKIVRDDNQFTVVLFT